MVIDFHTHAFPDKIAKKTIDFLAEKSNQTPYSDGSVLGLLSEMERGGIDLSVVLPVVTSPMQFESVNRFAKEINEKYFKDGKGLLSFGGIHPLCEDLEGKMKEIKRLGLPGVKIHPDYQNTFIDDDAYVKIMRCAIENDLIVVTHAGVDAGFPDAPVRCTPERVLDLLRKAPHKKLVLAHLGGNKMLSEVLDVIAGKDVYLDTAYVLRNVDKNGFCRLIEKHGEDKILFATDSPWSGMSEDKEIIKSFGLPSAAEKKIFSENAKKLLRI